MRIFNFSVLLFFLALALSCEKKKYPEPQVFENQAVYYSKLTVNNIPLTLEAGVNGYYMYSSYKLDSNFIYNFIADLKQSNCSTCPNSLKIQLNDYTSSSSPASAFLLDSSLRIGHYQYLADNNQVSYSVRFHSSTPADKYEWNFGDGTSSNLKDPLKLFDRSGNYQVSLKTTNGFCESTIANKEKINLYENSCKTVISASPDTGNSVFFNSTTIQGKEPYQYLWNFGDGNTSTNKSQIHAYKNKGAYGVSLRVVDSYGDTAYANYNAKTQNDISSCTANYYKTDLVKVYNTKIFSRILITWVNADGVVYTSRRGEQDSDSYFQVLSVNNSEMNENNQPTKKIRAKFKCKVYNGSDYILLDDADVTVSIAHK